MQQPVSRAAARLVATVGASLLVARVACADSEASLVTPPGASMVVTVQLTVSTALGTSSDTDTRTIAVVGDAQALFAPTDPGWTAVTLDEVHFDLANTTFHFDLFCLPFIGCQTIDVALTALELDSTAPMSSGIAKSGLASFSDAQFALRGDYVATGIASGAGALDSAAVGTFGCRVQALAGSIAKLDQCTMTPITTAVDPADLPTGVTAMTIVFTPNFNNVSLSGPWSPVNLFDLDGDGVVNAVDLASLLAQWGAAGSADFDGNGTVGAPDLAAMLAAWG